MTERTYPARMVKIERDLNYILDLDLGFDVMKRVPVSLEVSNLEPEEWSILSAKLDAVRIFVGFWVMDAQRGGADWPLNATIDVSVNNRYIARITEARTGESLAVAISRFVRGLG